jgi:chromosome segregation ATPase
MNGTKFVRVLCVLGLVVSSAMGCAKRESAEVTQQRTEMTQEHQAWNTDIANWEAQHSQLRATLTAPPAGGGAADTMGQSDRLARLSAHEANLATFRQQVTDMEQRMQAENADHEALYAEHQRLRAQYDMLKQEHESLAMGGTMGTPGDTTATY